MRTDIVCMNDEMMPPRFWTQSKNLFQNMFGIVRYIKYFSFQKEVDNVKPEKILCDCEHHFWSESYAFLFQGRFTVWQLDNFVIY
jgi:hypothetical protein